MEWVSAFQRVKVQPGGTLRETNEAGSIYDNREQMHLVALVIEMNGCVNFSATPAWGEFNNAAMSMNSIMHISTVCG